MTNNSKTRAAYHHGDLRRELIDKAAELLNEKGLGGFSLREVARRAEVAAAAPSHHFGNVTGLLTAVAAMGFQQLYAEQQNVLEKKSQPVDHLLGILKAYISHFKRNPGITSIMFQHDLLNTDNAELMDVRPKTLHVLKNAVRAALPRTATDKQVEMAAKTLWATVHGFVTLNIVQGKSLNDLVEFSVASVIAVTER